MPWNDAPQLESKLTRVLNDFNWVEAEALCKEIMERIKTDPQLFPEPSARRLMNSLRRKSRFHLMTQLAESLLQSGLRTPQVRRQYAQALIDQGILAAGEMVLQTIIHDPMGIKVEELEARGLTGRVYKQLYINNNDPKSTRNRANLEHALKEYLYVYRLAPEVNLWHGINVVALTDRAQRDNLPLAGLPDASALAQNILDALDKKEQESSGNLPAYDVATQMEAYVALGRHEEAAGTALRYIDSSDADAFELNSTLRQLTEVWQLNHYEPPGNYLLPILKAGYLRRAGATDISNPKKMIEEAEAIGDAVEGLEAIFGEDRMVSLKWYKKGLEQCNAIARIEKPGGKGHGTGWLVKASDFFPERQGKLLLTNAHVVCDTPNATSIFPEDARVNFQALGEVFEVEDEVVFTSPIIKLDATFLTLKGDPKAKPLVLHKKAMAMCEPPPRMYAIGHPGGRDLEFSLQDNQLLACNERLLHYRTPTEKGSSGSPIFEPEDWRVVALHHKANQEMPRLDEQYGTYQANEGIAILALQIATRKA
jgi:hypothetical protein